MENKVKCFIALNNAVQMNKTTINKIVITMLDSIQNNQSE